MIEKVKHLCEAIMFYTFANTILDGLETQNKPNPSIIVRMVDGSDDSSLVKTFTLKGLSQEGKAYVIGEIREDSENKGLVPFATYVTDRKKEEYILYGWDMSGNECVVSLKDNGASSKWWTRTDSVYMNTVTDFKFLASTITNIGYVHLYGDQR